MSGNMWFAIIFAGAAFAVLVYAMIRMANQKDLSSDYMEEYGLDFDEDEDEYL